MEGEKGEHGGLVLMFHYWQPLLSFWACQSHYSICSTVLYISIIFTIIPLPFSSVSTHFR